MKNMHNLTGKPRTEMARARSTDVRFVSLRAGRGKKHRSVTVPQQLQEVRANQAAKVE